MPCHVPVAEVKSEVKVPFTTKPLAIPEDWKGRLSTTNEPTVIGQGGVRLILPLVVTVPPPPQLKRKLCSIHVTPEWSSETPNLMGRPCSVSPEYSMSVGVDVGVAVVRLVEVAVGI